MDIFSTNFSTIDWVIVGVYLLGAVVVGVIANRYIHSVSAYLVGGGESGRVDGAPHPGGRAKFEAPRGAQRALDAARHHDLPGLDRRLEGGAFADFEALGTDHFAAHLTLDPRGAVEQHQALEASTGREGELHRGGLVVSVAPVRHPRAGYR